MRGLPRCCSSRPTKETSARSAIKTRKASTRLSRESRSRNSSLLAIGVCDGEGDQGEGEKLRDAAQGLEAREVVPHDLPSRPRTPRLPRGSPSSALAPAPAPHPPASGC